MSDYSKKSRAQKHLLQWKNLSKKKITYLVINAKERYEARTRGTSTDGYNKNKQRKNAKHVALLCSKSEDFVTKTESI